MRTIVDDDVERAMTEGRAELFFPRRISDCDGDVRTKVQPRAFRINVDTENLGARRKVLLPDLKRAAVLNTNLQERDRCASINDRGQLRLVDPEILLPLIGDMTGMGEEEVLESDGGHRYERCDRHFTFFNGNGYLSSGRVERAHVGSGPWVLMRRPWPVGREAIATPFSPANLSIPSLEG